MTPPDLTVDLALTHQLAPFLVVWSETGAITHISPALLRYWAQPDGLDPSAIVLMLQRPFSAALTNQWFPELTDMVLTVHCAEDSDRPLRAQLLQLADGKWLLVGRPDVSRITDLEKVGLTLSDLPVHMGIGDLLIANEAAHISLAESEKQATEYRILNQHLRATNETFSRFVPQLFLEALGLDSPRQAGLGAHVGVSKCIMFADLRRFTALSERMPAQKIFAFINEFLETIAPSIRRHGGFVVHYLGDGIMALFPEEPEGAIQAAIEMQHALRQWSSTTHFEHEAKLRLGIGIHFGHLELGIVGESGRWDSSVISDAVNTASRVEGLTKVFGANLLITREVADRLNEESSFSLRRLGRIPVKGRETLVDLFEVLDCLDAQTNENRLAMAPVFEQALVAYERDDLPSAKQGFQACLERDPNDLAALYYLQDPAPTAPMNYVQQRSKEPT